MNQLKIKWRSVGAQFTYIRHFIVCVAIFHVHQKDLLIFKVQFTDATGCWKILSSKSLQQTQKIIIYSKLQKQWYSMTIKYAQVQ